MSGGTTRRTEKALEKYKKFHYHKNGTVVVTDDWKGKGKVPIPKEYKPFAVVETKTEYRKEPSRSTAQFTMKAGV